MAGAIPKAFQGTEFRCLQTSVLTKMHWDVSYALKRDFDKFALHLQGGQVASGLVSSMRHENVDSSCPASTCTVLEEYITFPFSPLFLLLLPSNQAKQSHAGQCVVSSDHRRLHLRSLDPPRLLADPEKIEQHSTGARKGRRASRRGGGGGREEERS